MGAISLASIRGEPFAGGALGAGVGPTWGVVGHEQVQAGLKGKMRIDADSRRYYTYRGLT